MIVSETVANNSSVQIAQSAISIYSCQTGWLCVKKDWHHQYQKTAKVTH